MGNGKKLGKGADVINITDKKKSSGIMDGEMGLMQIRSGAEPEKSPGPERQEAIEALLALLDAKGKENIKITYNLETVTLLRSVVAMGIITLAAHPHGAEAMMLAARGFCEAVDKMWVRMGLTPEQCELIKQGIIVLKPR